MKTIAGAILAGGEASRFTHQPKGLLELPGGRTIIDHLLEEMGRAGVDPRVICANDVALYSNLGVPVIPDLTRGMGPLGGIEAALHYFKEKADGVLFLPCDAPYITVSEIRRLCEVFRQGERAIVVAETENGIWHPVCCVVQTGMLDKITLAVRNGHLGMKRLWKDLGAASVYFENAIRFVNINSPEEFEAALDALKSGTELIKKEPQSNKPGAEEKGGAMGKSIRVPEAMRVDFNALMAKENITLEAVSDGSSDISIEPGEERRESSISVLYPGGWIKCEVARAMAKKLSVGYGDIGKILNFLNIKIRDCALGCF